jgi:hypothetical protein
VLAASIGAFLVVLGAGCQRNEPSSRRGPTVAPDDVGVMELDHLAMAVSFLNELDQYDSPVAHRRILHHLYLWIEQQKSDKDWIADPMFGRLPERFENRHNAEVLSRMIFEPHDVYFLQEAMWMRDVSRRVSTEPIVDESLEKRLESMNAELGPEAVADLSVTMRLFDWTVRNVQLDSMEGDALSSSPSADQTPSSAAQSSQPIKAGASPGTKYYAWESLVLGHGDAWIRSRIFILLARQRGIPVVMLAVRDAMEAEPVPWLTAALVQDELFLFDMRLGLPIPDATDNGIATLRHVLDHPDLLQQLDLDSDHRYPITPSKLKHLVALIDATPAYLSQRMTLLESALLGEDRMVLSTSPTALSRQLRQGTGVTETALWTVPYDGFQYQRDLANNREALLESTRQHSLFRLVPPLAQGRRQHFRGQFENRPDAQGAKGLYLDCRVPDAQIKDLVGSQAGSTETGESTSRSEDDVRREQLASEAKELMLNVKLSASYWLGQIAYDSGDYEVAANYFQKRTLDAAPDGPWAQGARYNLARSHEAVGFTQDNPEMLDSARQLYLEDDKSPQWYGNQLRARRLERLVQTDDRVTGE